METLYNGIVSMFDMPIFYARNVLVKFVGVLKDIQI
jgi:hypothetical protein